jgi:hypothetical protein
MKAPSVPIRLMMNGAGMKYGGEASSPCRRAAT